MSTTVVGARFELDPIACDGRGLCAAAAPELVGLDDWGYPVLAPSAGSRLAQVVPSDLESVALDAVQVYPKLALRLRR